MDVLPLLDCSSSANKHEEEDDDDDGWVVVKKQKIIILIPPPYPPTQQTVKETSPKSTKRLKSSIEPLEPKPRGSDRFDRKPKAQHPLPSFRAHGAGNAGAARVANRRIRAMNLERRLRSLGGMRRWLSLLGLDRFAEVLETKKMGQHQLVNLSTTMLKEMGMNAVGPRRKLIHAIDLLCQPYYAQG